MTLPALFGVNEVETGQLAGTKPAGCRGSIVHCNMLCNKGTPLPFEGSASCMLVLSGVRVCSRARAKEEQHRRGHCIERCFGPMEAALSDG